MERIFFYSLKGRWKEYAVVLFCGIFTISILFWTTALGDCLYKIAPSGLSETVEEVFTFFSFLLTYELLFFLMILVLLSYIRKRSYDYTLLTLMGMRRKHKHIFIGGEYAGITLVSLGGGILVGSILAEISKMILGYCFPELSNEIFYDMSAFRLTIAAGIQFFFILFLVFDEVIACLGTDAIVSIGRKGGKPIRRHPKLLIIGMILLSAALISLWFYWGRVSKKFPILLAGVGIFVLLVTLGEYYFSSLKKKARKYYKKFFWLDSWYHRFFYNMNMGFIICFLIFTLMFGLSVRLFDNFPVYNEKNYPYDLVWMANDNDQAFINELETNDGVEVETKPCIRVTTADQGEQIGISESIFKEWTGKDIQLKEDEIYVVYQREKEAMDGIGTDFGTRNPRIYMGPANEDLWIYVRGVPMPREGFVRYHIKNWENRILTGLSSDAISNHIFVFSDRSYNKIHSNTEGADLVVMMQISGEYENIVSDIYEYAGEHSQKDYFTGEPLVYETQKLLPENYRGRLFKAIANGLNIFILLLCAVAVFGIKNSCDQPDREWKYKFYQHLGMTKDEMRKCLWKETAMSGMLPVVCGEIPAILFASAVIFIKQLSWAETGKYLLGILIEGILILLIFSITNGVAARKSMKKCLRGIHDGTKREKNDFTGGES